MTSTATQVRYFATRDSATAWRDEDRAMAHATIYSGDSLDEAREALKAYLLREAGHLMEGRSVTKPGDLWAIKRAAGLADLAQNVGELDPSDNPGSHKTVSREVEGLIWAITRTER